MVTMELLSLLAAAKSDAAISRHKSNVIPLFIDKPPYERE